MHKKQVKESVNCDLCGKSPPDVEIHLCDSFLCLCPACLKKLNAMPADTKEKIERYMLGNVV